MIVSIVIATRNEERYIEKCVSSFINQNYPKNNYEILVIDGHSNDRTKVIVEELKKNNIDTNIRIFDNPKIIQAAAWNLGFNISKSRYVCMMGGHSFVESDFIAKCVSVLENNPDVPCVGGIVNAIGENFKSKAIALTFNSRFGVGNAKYRYAQKQYYVETINYGMYRKSVVDKIGPISQTITRGQDWEYNYRIVSEFGKMIYSPEIKVFYYARNNFKRLWKKQFNGGLWKILIIKSHPESILLRHLVPLFFLSVIFISLFLLLVFQNPYCLYFTFGIYTLTNIIFSLNLVIKKQFTMIFLTIYSFIIMHVGYGFGSLIGLFKFSFRKSKVI